MRETTVMTSRSIRLRTSAGACIVPSFDHSNSSILSVPDLRAELDTFLSIPKIAGSLRIPKPPSSTEPMSYLDVDEDALIMQVKEAMEKRPLKLSKYAYAL